MGPAPGDVNGDGWMDVYFTNTYHGNLLLYNHCGTFQNGGTRKKLHVGILSWSSILADFDLNGELDLFLTTWHSGKNRLFLQHSGEWADHSIASGASGKFWESTTSVTGDFDQDGDLDLVVLNADSPLVFYQNTGPTGNSLRVRLQGTDSNRDAMGAVLRLHLRGTRQHRTRMSPNAFQASMDPTFTFGLGTLESAEALSVRWPNGSTEVFLGPFIGGSNVELIEGEGSSLWPEGIPWMTEFGGDQLDNDCDGQIDEGFADLGLPCSAGLGECEQTGITRFDLLRTQLVCDAIPLPPRTERCDGRDNDCDGVIDNGMMKDAPCWEGVGECRVDGLASCQGESGLVCDAVAKEPSEEERCGNGLDDDCDGEIDETEIDPSQACTVGTFPCDQVGTWSCTADGNWICTANEFPNKQDEICGNKIDDDCDGEIDETEQPLGSACPVSECQVGGTWSCDGTGTVICLPEPACNPDTTNLEDSTKEGGCGQARSRTPAMPIWLVFLLGALILSSSKGNPIRLHSKNTRGRIQA